MGMTEILNAVAVARRCVITRPTQTQQQTAQEPTQAPTSTAAQAPATASDPSSSITLSPIVFYSVNSTLFDPDSNKSDVHAEQNVIAAAAREGVRLAGCTAYITMPPCK